MAEIMDITIEILRDIRDGVRANGQRIEEMGTRLDARIDETNGRLDARIDETNSRLDARIDRTNALLAQMNVRMDRSEERQERMLGIMGENWRGHEERIVRLEDRIDVIEASS